MYSKLRQKIVAMAGGALLLLAGTNVSGQVIHLDEDFSSGSGATPPTGWTNNTIAGGAADTWRYNNPGGRAINAPLAGQAAVFDSDDYSAGSGAENVALESPVMDLTASTVVTLEFDHQFQGGFGGAGNVEVWDGSAWVSVYSINATTPIQNQTIDVSTELGGVSDAQVRFRWTGNWSWWWLVDNVMLSSPVQFDGALTDLIAPTAANTCGDAAQDVTVEITNAGSNALSNIDVTVEVTGDITTTLTGTFAGPLAANAVANYTLPSTLNTLPGGNLNFKAYIDAPNEQLRTNDTANYSLNLLGTPADPTASGGTRCGWGIVPLTGTPADPSDAVGWYRDMALTDKIGQGTSINSDTIGVTTTYYAVGERGFQESLQSTFNSNNGQSGNMFDVEAFSTFTIDSLAINFDPSGAQDVEVWYKLGTYVGFETNQAAWTLLGTDNVTSAGTDQPTIVNIGGLTLNGGQTYGFYVQLPNATTINYTNGNGANQIYTNNEMEIRAGAGKGQNFGATFSPRVWNGEIFYSNFCTSNPVAVTATVNPVPQDVEYAQGSTYTGLFRDGDMATPHVVASGDQVTFDILTPTGFNIADHGNTWEVTSIDMETVNGTPAPAAEVSTTLPSGTSDATITYSPTGGFADSLFTITTVITDLATNCDTTIITYLFEAPRPVVDFTTVSACDGDVIQLFNNSSIASGSLSFLWDFDDGNTSVQQDAIHQYATFGNYDVKLIVTSDLGYSDSVTKVVTINETPSTNFAVQFACETRDLQFTNQSTLSTGTGGLTYDWQFGDGNSSTMTDPSHLYATPGAYTVTLTADQNGCATTASKTVYQFPDPVADFTSVSGCASDPVVFTDGSSIMTYPNITSPITGYEWNFGDGNSASIASPTHQYDQAGTYTVEFITSTYFGCSDTITKQVTVSDVPVADFSTNDVCFGTDVDFTNGSTIGTGSFTSSWTFGDGVGTSTQDNPTYSYTNTGTFGVTLTVASGSCVDQIVKTVEIFETPTASFNTSDVCDGNDVVFNNTSTISTGNLVYTWNLGDGSTSNNSENVNYMYAGPGAYDVWLKVETGAGCNDSTMQTVNVNALPNSAFSSNPAPQRTYNFTAADGSQASYFWQFGDAATSTQTSPSYQYFYDGEFDVTLTVTSAEGCVTTTTNTITINTTGINDINALYGKFTMFPNPTTGLVNMKFEDVDYRKVSVSVVDMLGQEIYTAAEGDLNSENFSFDLTNQSAGIYLVKVRYEGQEATRKVTLR